MLSRDDLSVVYPPCFGYGVRWHLLSEKKMVILTECLDCGKPVHCSGRCKKHYKAWLYKQEPTPCACGCGELSKGFYVRGHHTKLFTKEEQSRRARHNDGAAQRARGDIISLYYRKVRGAHEHRAVAEQKYGRKLTFDDVVHHIDGNKRNNCPDNLVVMTRSEHIAIHRDQMVEARRAKSK